MFPNSTQTSYSGGSNQILSQTSLISNLANFNNTNNSNNNNNPFPSLRTNISNPNLNAYSTPMSNNITTSTNNNSNVAINKQQSNNNNNNNSSTSSTNKPKRKRNRIPLSCTICRKRKVKCDKTRPHCNQCTKTGVAHLCHYMEQTWAEEAERELSKEQELKQLRDRVKSLEETLSKVHSVYKNKNDSSLNDFSNPTSVSSKDLELSSNNNFNDKKFVILQKDLSNQTPSISDTPNKLAGDNNSDNPFAKYDNDELDLTRNFDMLHLKNEGTIHLGATHWLAIMKGDPYLKLIWAHIFHVREKISEWYLQKRINNASTNVIQNNNNNNNNNINNNHNNKNAMTSLGINNNNNNNIPIKNEIDDPSNTNCPFNYGKPLKQENSQYSSLPMPKRDSNPSSTQPPFSKFSNPNNNNLQTNMTPHLSSSLRGPPISSANTTTNNNAQPPNPTMNLPPNHPAIMAANNSKADISQCPVAGKMSTQPNTKSTNSKTILRCPVTGLTSEGYNPHSTKSQLGSKRNSGKRVFQGVPVLSHEQVIKKLCAILPPKGVICCFVDKFFEFLYPVIPIIDEQNFKNSIIHILSLQSWNTIDQNKVKGLNISKNKDYSILGILVLVLRLTWLSLPSNACKIDFKDKCKSIILPTVPIALPTGQIKEESLLLKNETSLEALELVRKNLIKFDELSSTSNSNVNLDTIQFAIFYKLYLMCCPYEPDEVMFKNSQGSQDNESHQMLLASISQMAFSCGLHRDPDNFPQLNTVSSTHLASGIKQEGQSGENYNSTNNNFATNDQTAEPNISDPSTPRVNKETQAITERFKHSWRKTWYYIVSLDIQQSLLLGTPRLLRNLTDISDTKLPSASRIDYVRDIKELIIVKNFTLFFQIDLCIIAVLNHILNISVSKSVRKFELDELISALYDLTYAKKPVQDIVNLLVNKGLLYTTEGKVDQTLYDENYSLPSLEEIIDQQSTLGRDSESEKKIDLAHESTTRALFFAKHLTIRMLLYLLNYILFTYYEPRGVEDPDTTVLAKKYAQETLNYAMEGYRGCLLFFANLKNVGSQNFIFNYMEVVLMPYCLNVGNRSLQFIVCLLLRIKCGPLSGTSENTVFGGGSASASGVSSGEESDSNRRRMKLEGTEAERNEEVVKNIDLNNPEFLADKLTHRMLLFFDLTSQVSKKYHYALKMMRATRFFVSLLKNPDKKDNKKNHLVPKHPGIPKIFRNMPIFMMSGDQDSIKRCPVYQDALGLVTPKGINMGTSMMSPHSSRMGSTKLPPIRSYKPITYQDRDPTNGKQRSEKWNTKKRRLNDGDAQNKSTNWSSNPMATPLPSLQEQMSPDVGGSNSMLTLDNSMALPNKLNGSLTPLQMEKKDWKLDFSNNNMGGATAMSNNGKLSAGNSMSDLRSVQSGKNWATNNAENNMGFNELVPDFEDFLLQNSNLNGLMINPSSIAEAVGLTAMDSDTSSRNDASDFLPIDNNLTGIPDFSNSDFFVWE